MENKFQAIELEEFIKGTIDQIERGANVKKRSFKGAMDFEVSIRKTRKLEGNIKIYVVSGEGELKNEEIAKIKFSIYPDMHNPKPSVTSVPYGEY